jgi:hypothetical protein
MIVMKKRQIRAWMIRLKMYLFIYRPSSRRRVYRSAATGLASSCLITNTATKGPGVI